MALRGPTRAAGQGFASRRASSHEHDAAAASRCAGGAPRRAEVGGRDPNCSATSCATSRTPRTALGALARASMRAQVAEWRPRPSDGRQSAAVAPARASNRRRRGAQCGPRTHVVIARRKFEQRVGRIRRRIHLGLGSVGASLAHFCGAKAVWLALSWTMTSSRENVVWGVQNAALRTHAHRHCRRQAALAPSLAHILCAHSNVTRAGTTDDIKPCKQRLVRIMRPWPCAAAASRCRGRRSCP